ncbi:MAG: hypothetical protein ACRC9K_15140 [Afipia sp.]
MINNSDISSLAWYNAVGRMKLAIYGFGSFPVVCWHLFKLADERGIKIDSCVILTTPHHRDLVRSFADDPNVLDVFEALPRKPGNGDASELAGYHGNFTEDLAAQKFYRTSQSGQWLFDRGLDYYRLYKRFLQDQKATHLLAPWPETADGKILFAIAAELGIRVISPNDLRNLSGSFFSTSPYETLPAYAATTPELLNAADQFVRRFRETGGTAALAPVKPDDATLLDPFRSALPARIAGMFRQTLQRPDLFQPINIRIGLMNSFPAVRDAYWSLNTRRNAKQADITSLDDLPKKFLFYPLHSTPEASINTPAPYYVDQFRAIDAIRMAMPSDHILVVKEHWTFVMTRPTRFLKAIRRLPGVLVADYRLKAFDLMPRAAATVTVTGTAGFEAFLLGYPALALGRGLTADSLGGMTHKSEIAQHLRDRIEKPISTQAVIKRVAQFFSARYPFYFSSTGYTGEPVLRRGNIRAMLDALLDHIARDSQSSSGVNADN